MGQQIKTLPILERWDCAGCGNCCRGTIIPLNDDDIAKLNDQHWERHPALHTTKTKVRVGWPARQFRLAQRSNGDCVFLMEDNRCRIHVEHGADAKPLVCRMFPFQLVPHAEHAVLTVRRSCPSAAAERGRELEVHRKAVVGLARRAGLLEKSVQPPRIAKRFRGHVGENLEGSQRHSTQGNWAAFQQVTASVRELLCDQRFPLVRRLAHSLRFCSLLDECRLPEFSGTDVDAVLSGLGPSCYEESRELFRERQPPNSATGALFRQIALQYLRLHPAYRVRASWAERWRLARVAISFARGRGCTPQLVPGLPRVPFDALEEPLGPLTESVQQPLVRFYESNAGSLQYTIASRRGWNFTESLRAMALAYPVALWLLRWISHGREPTNADAVEVVTILDRGQGHEPLTGMHHRRRVAVLAATDAIERLVAWYAR